MSGDLLTHHSSADHVQDQATTCVEDEWLYAAMKTCCKYAMSSTDDVIGDGEESELTETSSEYISSLVSK